MNRRTTHVMIWTLLILSVALTSVARAELVGWWKFDEIEGTVAADSSGNGYDGTLYGNPTWVAGHFDGALNLDGSGDYVQLDIGELVPTLQECTLAIWVKRATTEAGWARIIDFGDGDTTNYNYIYVCADDGGAQSLRVAIVAGNGIWNEVMLTDAAITTTDWTHVAVTISDSARRMVVYRDGREVGSMGAMNNSVDDLGATTNNWLGRSTYSADPYFNGALDDLRIYNEVLDVDGVAKAMYGSGEGASRPNPRDRATDVVRDTTLGWAPGESAATHNVYMGTVQEDVAAAGEADPRGVLVGKGQDANSYVPPQRLDFGTTYYWRVDEVEAGGTIHPGGVWSFTVEPYSYPITGVMATASSQSKPDVGPEKTVDGSGLNANDEHGTLAEDEWLSAKGPSAWIQYDLGKTYKLDEMMVWNSNQALESLFGFGAKNVTVEYSIDGEDWTALGDYEFAKAPGSPDYVSDIIVDFAGVPVRHIKLTIASNWGGVFQQYGLSEVRFYYIPVAAREPSPEPNAADVDPREPLSWRAGREAASHDVYVGTDPNAVADSAVAPITATQPQCDADLNLDATYYWKVVEINQAETYSAWDSDVWSFSTASFITVDDFEDYTNNSPGRVFQTWFDGGGFSPDDFFPNGNPGNGTGSFAGYDPALGDVMELVLVYDGIQSLPLYYDNGAAPKISEVTRTFATPQDWSKHGITTLVLFFYGDAANGAAPLYVKLNDTKVIYNDGAAATTKAMWQQWNIPLASMAGVNLQSVKSLTIGVGDGVSGGTGTILVDGIRLYANPPAIVVPADPGTGNLAALYAMEGNVQDSSGKNLHGTANGEPGYVDGPAGMGKALAFDGVNDYVDLPIGNLISTMESGTFAAWVDYANAGAAWQRVLDFNMNNTTIYMFLTPDGPGGNVRFAITTGGNAAGAEQQLTSPADFPSGWHHVAVVIDGATMTQSLYLDGTPVDSQPTTLLPKDLGVTTNNWLGRSIYTDDPYYNGSIDDFRIYDRALSASEVRYLAGDR